MYDSHSISRDKKIKSLLKQEGINCRTFNSYLLNEPWEIKNKTGSFFKVFTPYWRHCNETIRNRIFKLKIQKIKFCNHNLKNSKNIQDLNLTNKKLKWTDKINKYWLPGEQNAQLQLQEFINNKADNYSIGRDRPDQNLTSRLSPYLHLVKFHQSRYMIKLEHQKKLILKIKINF